MCCKGIVFERVIYYSCVVCFFDEHYLDKNEKTMKFTVMCCIVMFVVVSSVFAASRTVQLQNNEDIKQAMLLDDTISQLAKSVAQSRCATNVQDTACFYQFSSQVHAVEEQIVHFAKLYPDWKDASLQYQHDGKSYYVDLYELKKQINICKL